MFEISPDASISWVCGCDLTCSILVIPSSVPHPFALNPMCDTDHEALNLCTEIHLYHCHFFGFGGMERDMYYVQSLHETLRGTPSVLLPLYCMSAADAGVSRSRFNALA